MHQLTQTPLFASLGVQNANQHASMRTRVPVRRHSYPYQNGQLFYRPITRRTGRQIVQAARMFDCDTRQPGQRNGALGSVALEIIDYLANLIDFKTGRLEPSLLYLVEKLKRSKAAIVRGLQALRQHGFIDWIRRFERIANDGAGPQVKQSSNAYRLSLPQRAAKLLGRYYKDVPLAGDLEHHERDQRSSYDAMLASMPLSDQPRMIVADPSLEAALAKLGSVIEERESAKRSESPSKISLYRNSDPQGT